MLYFDFAIHLILQQIISSEFPFFTTNLLIAISYILASIFFSLKLSSSQSSEFLGSVSILIKGGSESAPNHSIISPSLKGRSVFRGQVLRTSDNNISFYRIPDLLDPTILSKPFKPEYSTPKKHGRLLS